MSNNKKTIWFLVLVLMFLIISLVLVLKGCGSEPKTPDKVYVVPTSTLVPTETQIPTPTNTPEPEPTPTNTPEPTPIPTEISQHTPIPTTSLQVVDSGKGMSPASLKIIGMFRDIKETKIEILLFLISICVGMLAYQIIKTFFSKKGENKN